MNPERILIAAESVGLGRCALARATGYAKERVVFDRPIGKNQGRTMSEEQAIQMMRKASGNKSLTGEDMANMSDAEIEAMARKAAKRQ